MNIAKSSRRKGFTLVELLVVIAIIVALAALATPQIFKALKRAALAEAISNSKQVKLALDSFATDFDGQYPSEDPKAMCFISCMHKYSPFFVENEILFVDSMYCFLFFC